MKGVPERVAILRALPGLGDMLCAGPALRAMRTGWPDAHLALVVLPGTETLAARVLPMIDETLPFPGCPGIPERSVPDPPWPVFRAAMQARRWDLAVQMHGDGSHLDAFMPQLAASRSVGYLPAAACPANGPDWFPYPETGHEILRWTGLMRQLGLPDRGTDLQFADHPGDRAALAALLDARPGRYVCLHPGASTPVRRWPAERFAAIGDALADRGHSVVLTGTAGEKAITAAVAGAMRHPAIDLAGRTPLGVLALLLRRAALLVSNDTGVAHLAVATRTPSVTVFLAADPDRWAPLDRDRHRIVVAGRLRGQPDAPLPATDEVLAQAEALLR
ncbi:glycosyl transferase family protein [Oceaniovalibus guishaninsula JLT2003]|uniref:Glycosyl transferase family protein n=1 Tax=Oceaniovalibus guishaninsula JLT2003 TaxID=1231392 RepID=K2I4M0_9RHOB|nr:glycosyltransferase family 9 protein [Oceaniovalibus guishaninsula]EKE43850.1 glycosyl transferase family protein [Oceaniovalibus guishaninsula JLT2003]